MKRITFIILWFTLPLLATGQDTIYYKKGIDFEAFVKTNSDHYDFFLCYKNKVDSIFRYRFAKQVGVNIDDIFFKDGYYIFIYQAVDVILCGVYKKENDIWKPYIISTLKFTYNFHYSIKANIASMHKITLKWNKKKDIYKIDYKNQRIIPVKVRKKPPSEFFQYSE
jgi:hypothetical protein